MKGTNGVHCKQEILTDVRTFFQNEIVNDPAFNIEPQTDIIRGGLIDSMGIVRLMVHLQQRYDIDDFHRSDVILDNFRTIDRISEMVLRYIPDDSADCADGTTASLLTDCSADTGGTHD